MDISTIIAGNRQAREAETAATAAARAEAQAKAQKKAALFATLDQLVAEIQQAYVRRDYPRRDAVCLRILVLTRHHLRQRGKAKFRLRIVWYSCRAYTALGPIQVKQHLERFEAELISCLSDIPQMPDWIGVALKNIQERARKADAQDSGVRKTVGRSVADQKQGSQPTKKPPARKPGGGSKKHDRRRHGAQERLEERFESRGPVLVASCGEAGETAMAGALRDAGLAANNAESEVAAAA